MPLPAALLARLQKRGIVNEDKPIEEVFAENYDEKGDVSKKFVDDFDYINEPFYENGILTATSSLCPNQNNPYHKCSLYCFKHYGRKRFNPSPEYLRKRNRMLIRYPLPDYWLEVGDPSTNHYYYWNVKTEMVSWLSPAHPRAKITKCDSIMKEIALKEREAAITAANRANAILEQTGANFNDQNSPRRRQKNRTRSSSSSYDSQDDRDRHRQRHGGKDSDSDDDRRPNRRYRSRSRSPLSDAS